MFGILAVCLPACIAPGFPSAATIVDGAPVIVFKQCSRLAGITALFIRRGLYGDGPMPTAWTARALPHSRLLFEIPISDSVPGYTVSSRVALDPAVFYTAEGSDHGNFVGGPQFRVADLAPGRATTGDDPQGGMRSEPLSSWRGTKSDCPDRLRARDNRIGLIFEAIVLFGFITAGANALARRRRKIPRA